MKRLTLLSIFMLFICVYPAETAQAGGEKTLGAGDYLVHIGEMELEKGDMDAAVHEFSKALLAEPNHEKAQQYLRELGYEGGIYRAQSSYLPQSSQAASRMEIIASHMNQVEAQHHMAESKMVSAASVECRDYYDGFYDRAGIETLCDGTKQLIREPWHMKESFIRRIGRDSEDEKISYRNDKGSYTENLRGSAKGSIKGSGKSGFSNSSNSFMSSPQEEFTHPQMAHIAPQSTNTPQDKRVLSKLKEAYHLNQQYDYESFLKGQYFQTQEELMNRTDTIEEQHVYLVKLHWELEEARDQIQQLLKEREELLNHTVNEVRQFRENGRIE